MGAATSSVRSYKREGDWVLAGFYRARSRLQHLLRAFARVQLITRSKWLAFSIIKIQYRVCVRSFSIVFGESLERGRARRNISGEPKSPLVIVKSRVGKIKLRSAEVLLGWPLSFYRPLLHLAPNMGQVYSRVRARLLPSSRQKGFSFNQISNRAALD